MDRTRSWTTVRLWMAVAALIWIGCAGAGAAEPTTPTVMDRELAEYFAAETDTLAAACLAEVKTLDDWRAERVERRRQLFEMLGLWPLPPRTDLEPVVTGTLDHEGFTVEKLHFQSMPGLYVTADLYLPKGLAKPAPAILYACGHAEVKTNGVSLGNKTYYQHHGAWFASHGYACLVLDTLQLGEIQGVHHGTYRLGQWWWNSRGYTPAGVEAWNCIRALDYLESRPEVDRTRLGMTGRSGGGSYTWTTAALDDRVAAAAPVAGITDLHNQVVDGAVEGHCDCMFFVNTHRWDLPLVAALIAPRPLLIVNSDADHIFPLDGVERLHAKVRRLYRLYGADTNLGLVIGPGEHQDTQDLQVPVFRWFNQRLKGEDPLIEDAAKPAFAPSDLRVFSQLPDDQRNTRVAESFVTAPLASRPAAPLARESLQRALRDRVFGGWPNAAGPLHLAPVFRAERQGIQLRAFDFESEPHVRLRLFLADAPRGAPPKTIELQALDTNSWTGWLKLFGAAFPAELGMSAEPGHPERVTGGDGLQSLRERCATGATMLAWVAPRGIGPCAWSGDARKQIQIRRRFMLLGRTLDGMRVWDIRRAVAAVSEAARSGGAAGRPLPVHIEASGGMAVNALYAGLFESRATALTLHGLPNSQKEGPDYLNILQVTDLPGALDTVRLGTSISVLP